MTNKDANELFWYYRSLMRKTLLYTKKHPEHLNDADTKKAHSIIYTNYMRQSAMLYKDEYTQEFVKNMEYIFNAHIKCFPDEVEDYKDDAMFLLNLYIKTFSKI